MPLEELATLTAAGRASAAPTTPTHACRKQPASRKTCPLFSFDEKLPCSPTALALTHANAANAYSPASSVSFTSPIKSPMSRNLIILFLSGKNKNLAPLPLRLGESCLKSLNQLGGARRLRVNAMTHICLKNILITEGTKSLNTVKLGRQSGIESLVNSLDY